MTAIPATNTTHHAIPSSKDDAAHPFLRYLPAIETHAKIRLRHLPPGDREEAVAEAIAGAYLNFVSVQSRGKTLAVTPATLANYGVLHVTDYRHVGGSRESTRDVTSRRAQRAHGFRCQPIHYGSGGPYCCMTDPTSPVYRLVLLEDRKTPVPDQAAFRTDWSSFLAGQTDRTRRAMSMLAAGHRRCEVADALGTTRSAVTQRMNRVRRDWGVFQGQSDGAAPDAEDPSGKEAQVRPCPQSHTPTPCASLHG